MIQGLHVNFDSTKASGTSHTTTNLYMSLQPEMSLNPKKLPEDLKYIQYWTSQVLNCDEIGFDFNGSWRKVVCTYKLFTGERIWRNQTGDKEPFYCTALIFTRADVQ